MAPVTAARGAIAAVLLACAAGCGDATIDVGPATPTDPCGFFGSCAGRPSTVQGTISYRHDGQPMNASSVDAILVGPAVVFNGRGVEGSLDVTVWAQGPGVFRCEDPATAGRTHVTYLYGYDTAFGGACAIEISRFPTAEDPRLEGTFSVTFDASVYTKASKIDQGSFSLSGVGRF